MRFDEIITPEIESKHDILNKYFSFRGGWSQSSNGITINGPTRLNKPEINKLPISIYRANGEFSVSGSGLTTLEGCPEIVDGEFSCNWTKITSLIGGPKEVYGHYMCIGNDLTSLDGLPRQITDKITISYQEHMPILKLLEIRDLKTISFTTTSLPTANELSSLMNRYIGKGRGGILQCAAELSKAGFKSNIRK